MAKVIYVAGAYRAPTEKGTEENIARARAVAINLWKAGWVVICPHANSAHMPISEDMVLNGDLELVSRSDAIYMMQNWDLSEGARNEFRLATSLGLEIFDGGLLKSMADCLRKKNKIDKEVK